MEEILVKRREIRKKQRKVIRMETQFLKPVHTILFPPNNEDKEKPPQAAMANSLEEFGATSVVVRDAGVSPALVL